MERNGLRDLLEARVEDAIAKCGRGILSCVSFLTPRERKQAERYLRRAGAWEQAWWWGGYETAERACLFLLPDYLCACLSAIPTECPADEVQALLGEDAEEAVSAVLIEGSGYATLSHRDFLGAILATGLERDALGDVAVQDTRRAVLFCPRTLVPFLCETLERVGSDTVRVRSYVPAADFTDGRHYQPIRDTVASERLDCVVAALCNLSRDASQALIRSGAVEVDFEECDRVDLSLTPPVTLSARGFGRFILRSFDGETKKGRLRLCADKLV